MPYVPVVSVPAGIVPKTRAGGPPSQADLDAMREVYETNVFGVIIVTKGAEA